MAKFVLCCPACSGIIDTMRNWFSYGQKCLTCGSDKVNVVYCDRSKFSSLLRPEARRDLSIWHYFDFLPLDSRTNIVTAGEGNVAIDRWRFLEHYARERHGLDVRVYAQRNDNNFSTGTFKDLAGSVVASVLKENGVDSYVVASTGNIGVAFARYLSEADIHLYVFIPDEASILQAAEISCFGQRVFRVKGDYSTTKDVAGAFAREKGFLLAGGTYDPMRVEAKKTMAYDWALKMEEMPTVYIQALSGGTGPLGVFLGCNDMRACGVLTKIPRFNLIQTDRCAPMAVGWQNAKVGGFEKGWEERYPIIHDPDTSIPTLATGNPTAFPVVGDMVRQSEGEILTFPEKATLTISRLVAFEAGVRIGPAAAVAVGGFFSSLYNHSIKSGDVVLLNIGEGIRRAPQFMSQMTQMVSTVYSSSDCNVFNRRRVYEDIWSELDTMIFGAGDPANESTSNLFCDGRYNDSN